MAYVTTGRLLLANSFTQFSPETFRDLTRTFPISYRRPRARGPWTPSCPTSPAVYRF